MKRLVFAVVTALVLASGVFAFSEAELNQGVGMISYTIIAQGVISGREISEQEFKKQFEWFVLNGFVENVSDVLIEYKRDYNVADAITTINGKIEQLQSIRNKILNKCKGQNSAECALVNDRNKIYEYGISKRDSEWNKYKTEGIKQQQEAVAKAKQDSIARIQQAKQDSIARIQQAKQDSIAQAQQQQKQMEERKRFLGMGGGVINIDEVHEYFNNKSSKSQYETQEAFNKRLDALYNDSTEFYLKKFLSKKVNEILKEISDPESFFESFGYTTLDLGEYDAEKGAFGNVKYNTSMLSAYGSLIISPQEAQNLSEFKIYRDKNPMIFVFVEALYNWFPTQLTIINKNFGKEYTAKFSNFSREVLYPTDIVFKGKYLWEGNPKAANFEYKFADLVKEKENQQQKEAAVVEKAEKLIDSILNAKEFKKAKPYYVKQNELEPVDKDHYYSIIDIDRSIDRVIEKVANFIGMCSSVKNKKLEVSFLSGFTWVCLAKFFNTLPIPKQGLENQWEEIEYQKMLDGYTRQSAKDAIKEFENVIPLLKGDASKSDFIKISEHYLLWLQDIIKSLDE